MRLALHDLHINHPLLKGHLVDLYKSGALAFERASHISPVRAEVDHDGLAATVEIEWVSNNVMDLDVSDAHRLTEDGAEAVALAYIYAKSGWVVKRRLQRGESADWLLKNGAAWLPSR